MNKLQVIESMAAAAGNAAADERPHTWDPMLRTLLAAAARTYRDGAEARFAVERAWNTALDYACEERARLSVPPGHKTRIDGGIARRYHVVRYREAHRRDVAVTTRCAEIGTVAHVREEAGIQ